MLPADCSPSSSDTIATNRIREGLEFFKFEQGQREEKMMKIMLSAGPLNSIWATKFREMRTKTTFQDQLSKYPSNEWWSEVNLFESLNKTAACESRWPQGEHRELYTLLTASWATAWKELSANAEERRGGSLQKAAIPTLGRDSNGGDPLSSLISCGWCQWKDVDTVPWQEQWSYHQVEKQRKETSLWGQPGLGK